MMFSAAQIAALIQGTVEGDANVGVHTFAKIEEGKQGALSFLANEKYEDHLYSCESSVIIISTALQLQKPISATIIRVENPYLAFATLLQQYEALKPKKSGREHPVNIGENTSIGEDEFIGAFTSIGKNVFIGKGVKIYGQVFIGDNVRIGDHTEIYAGARIYNDCKIGNHCTIHSGTVIGSDGFGFAPNSDNQYQKIPQIGNVIIEDRVEIGSNCTIDRATMGSTIIKKGVKLDNLIQVAHNVVIGENTVIAAQSGIAGSSKIGKNCMIGGQVGISGHLTIADGTKIAAQSGIGKSISKENTIIQGSPAFEAMTYNKSYVLFRKLPELYQKITNLQKEISKFSHQK